MQKGQIGVTTENIFPVIKKFLYSDNEIFLRELVANAIDATQKLKTLASFGDFKGELGDMRVEVKVDKEAGTLTVTDHGIGMTADDVNKYINQIAFSGAEEFVNKYKDNANSIIGHFGLGFYSAFMVSKKVEIRSLSYKDGSEAVRWECDGSPEYTMEPCDKTTRGTEITLWIDDDNKEYLEQARIDLLLKKYCRFLPVPVVSGKEQEWKDGKYVDTDRDKVINATEPAWTKKPSELTDEDYRNFYRELYPGQEDPLFWIHLNVDYPFTLTGILYFPKIKNNLDIRKDRIQLYCNQVFVTDSVEGVVPEFMMLLQGVIDSPDIPLNVSRSYLQSDRAVKKISGYITKKVASRLEDLFKNDRADFESKWDDIKIFIEYGMLTDEKFCDAALKFTLLRDTEGKYFTLDEYKALIEASQTDKEGNLVYIYATDPVEQYSYIEAANAKGYNVLLMNGQLDGHFISMLENKLEKTTFVRVDSDVADNLVAKADKKDSGLTPDQISLLTSVFRSQLPKMEKSEFMVSFESLDPAANPVLITQNEYMRRMKDMAATQPGMSFYAELPDNFNLIVNTSQEAVARVLADAEKALDEKISPLRAAVSADNERLTAIRAEVKDNKPTPEQEAEEKKLLDSVENSRKEQESIISAYASGVPAVKQMIDLALLGNGLLQGRELSEFINRSVKML
ncbi:molecular chaperone HtpG [uncultured Duncaniella sp.]|jgi:molecular chaperone HtpG|uniref:molecular chaperone HtpG n=1 Tax=uncultured Duncaniella sp. TaxID=2768039 RepID=UPI0026767F83|nr:molecular chaperone HtpG [uncultured Duncaniella sp.]MCI9173138.1 molecular chaperone HtpG [Muribaculaceae bacterium]